MVWLCSSLGFNALRFISTSHLPQVPGCVPYKNICCGEKNHRTQINLDQVLYRVKFPETFHSSNLPTFHTVSYCWSALKRPFWAFHIQHPSFSGENFEWIVILCFFGLRLAMICGINFLIPSWSSQELVINDLDRYEVQVDDWHLGRLLHRFALPWELLSRSWLSGKPCCWNHRMQGILKYGEKTYFSTWRQWYLDHNFSGISDFSLPCSARRPLLHVAA